MRANTPFPAAPLPIVIHGESNAASVENPTFWNGSARNVATNSIECPGANDVVVYAWAPLSVSTPPPTVAEPPPTHWLVPQPAGSDEPENSSCTAPASVTSPSPVWVTTVLAPVLPCAKSAARRSSAHGATGIAKLAGAAGGSGEVASLFEASDERTR